VTGYCTPPGTAPGVATAAGIATAISDGNVGEGEGLSVVWRDDELLSALGRMSRNVASISVAFDVSADRQLVDLLLTWRAGFEPFRDGASAMVWTSDRRRSAEDAHRDRFGGERVGSRAVWAGRERRRTLQIVKLTTEWGLGR
jgi:hypothetical protein